MAKTQNGRIEVAAAKHPAYTTGYALREVMGLSRRLGNYVLGINRGFAVFGTHSDREPAIHFSNLDEVATAVAFCSQLSLSKVVEAESEEGA